MKKQQLVAGAFFVALIVWMAVPRDDQINSDLAVDASDTRIAALPEGRASSESPGVMTVRAERIGAQAYIEKIRVRGRTQAFRHVEVRAEEPGRIVSEPISRGARVKQGDILCEIAVDNRQANLQESLSRKEQAQFEYAAALDLQEKGLQSDVIVAQLNASLEASKAAVARAELALRNTKIIAPFDGIVETRTVEMGDLLNIGSVCASVLDDSPMLLIGLVPEQDVSGLVVGAAVNGQLLTGETVKGTVRYIARAADPVSRSYRIEIAVDEEYTDLREGITVELMVEANEINAYRIPSSSLTLDDGGSVGVKVLNNNNEVEFQRVQIIGDETNQLDPGIWITGLVSDVTLITVGQEIVFPGQTVEVNFDWDL